PNVASGKRTSLAHTTWGHTQIERGDVVGIELAGVVKRYHTPLYRSVVIGPPTSLQRDIASVLQAANQRGLETLRAGVTAGEVYMATRSVINRRGFSHLPEYRLGYSVGIGSPPTWAQQLGVNIVSDSKEELVSGMVFHFLT